MSEKLEPVSETIGRDPRNFQPPVAIENAAAEMAAAIEEVGTLPKPNVYPFPPLRRLDHPSRLPGEQCDIMDRPGAGGVPRTARNVISMEPRNFPTDTNATLQSKINERIREDPILVHMREIIDSHTDHGVTVELFNDIQTLSHELKDIEETTLQEVMPTLQRAKNLLTSLQTAGITPFAHTNSLGGKFKRFLYNTSSKEQEIAHAVQKSILLLTEGHKKREKQLREMEESAFTRKEEEKKRAA